MWNVHVILIHVVFHIHIVILLYGNNDVIIWWLSCHISDQLWSDDADWFAVWPHTGSGLHRTHPKIHIQLLKSWTSFAKCEVCDRLNHKKNEKSASLMWGPAAISHKVELLVYFRDNVVGNKTSKNKLMEWWHVLQFVDPNTFAFTFFAYDVVEHRWVFICLSLIFHYILPKNT